MAAVIEYAFYKRMANFLDRIRELLVTLLRDKECVDFRFGLSQSLIHQIDAFYKVASLLCATGLFEERQGLLKDGTFLTGE